MPYRAVGAQRVLSKAAAQILLKINALRFDPLTESSFYIDTQALHDHPQATARLIDIMADSLVPLNPRDVMGADLEEQDLVDGLRDRLRLPKDHDRPVLTVAWSQSHLGPEGGIALFDDENLAPMTNPLDPHEPLRASLVHLNDVLDVMHLTGMGETRSRFAAASLLRDRRA